MKKTIILTFIILIITTVILINLTKNDERQINLGSGYYYIPFQEVIFDVTRFGGNGIYIYKGNRKIPIIFSEIENYKYDSKYIIIKQKFDLKTRYLLESLIFTPNLYFDYDKEFVFLDEKYLSGIKSIKNSVEKEEYIDKIMHEDRRIKIMIENGVNYYIIDKKNNKIFGPLKNIDFQNLKLKMGIVIDF